MPKTEKKKEVDPTVFQVKRVRLSFPNLFKPRPKFGEKNVTAADIANPEKRAELLAAGRVRYDAQFIADPSEVDLDPMRAAMKAAMIEKFGKVLKLKPDHNPVKKASDRYDEDEDKFTTDGLEEGFVFFSAWAKQAPPCYSRARKRVEDPSVFYGGCYVNVVLKAFGYDQEAKGVAFSLRGVQFCEDGEPFGGSVDPEDFFDELEEDFDDMDPGDFEDDDDPLA